MHGINKSRIVKVQTFHPSPSEEKVWFLTVAQLGTDHWSQPAQPTPLKYDQSTVKCSEVTCGAVNCSEVKCGAVNCSAVKWSAVLWSCPLHTLPVATPQPGPINQFPMDHFTSSCTHTLFVFASNLLWPNLWLIVNVSDLCRQKVSGCGWLKLNVTVFDCIYIVVLVCAYIPISVTVCICYMSKCGNLTLSKKNWEQNLLLSFIDCY